MDEITEATPATARPPPGPDGAPVAPPDADLAALARLAPIDELPAYEQRALLAQGDLLVLAPGTTLRVTADDHARAHYLLAGTIGLAAPDQPRLRLAAGDLEARFPLDPARTPWQVQALGAVPARLFRVRRTLLDQCLAHAALARPSSELEVTELGGAGSEDDWVDRLLRRGMLAMLPPEMILQVLLRGRERAVAAGETLIEQGASDDTFYLIKSGRARVARQIGRGGLIHLAELGPGDGVGEEALVADSLRNATVSMLTDGVLLELGRADFQELVRDPLLRRVTRAEAETEVSHGACWLDVRYEAEFARAHLPAADNLPLPMLRLHYDRLAPGRRYITYSDDAAQAAVAAFLLSARGIDALCLAGGIDVASLPVATAADTSPYPPSVAVEEAAMTADPPAPSLLTSDDPNTLPESPERYADTYTGQSLARLVEEIHASGIAANTTTAEPPPREDARIALDDTLFRLQPVDEDATPDVAAALPTSPAAATVAPADELAAALSDFERRLRDHVDAVRHEERARYERRFAERVALMRKRAEEVLREKLLQTRARDREHLAAREQQLNDMHVRLTALVNKVTHQKARIQDARRQLAEKLALVASLHTELDNLGQNVTRELDDLDGIIPDQAGREA